MPPRTRRSDPSQPGFGRRRAGRGFRYVDEHGAPLRDEATLERIEALVIPPAWQNVWISPDERGHIQAVGVDEAGRRQYRYHDAFAARRSAAKWQRVESFGAVLGAQLRPAVRELTADPSLGARDAEHAVGWCVRLLDRSLLRVGSLEYARRNGTYGLCTLRRRHVSIELGSGTLCLRFVGKHGRHHDVTIVDEGLATAIDVLLEGRGRDAPMLAWRDGRRWRCVTPARVNRFIAEHHPGSTAKDFRSWHGSVLAATGLAIEGRLHPEAPRESLVPRVVEQVAAVLGNTPAVTRSAYVHPGLLDRWMDGDDIGPAIAVAERVEDVSRPELRDVAERALLDLLAGYTDRTMRAHAREELARAAG